MAQAHSRLRYPSATRRRELLQIAETLCAEEGLEALKLREVARRAGMAPASIYNHFSSLDDLLAGVVDTLLGDMTNAYEEAADLPPDEAVLSIVKTHVAAFAARPGAARIVLTDFDKPQGITALDQVETRIEHIHALEKSLISRGFEQKLFREVNPHDVLLARIGMTLTLLSDRWYESPRLTDEETERVASTIAEFTLRILRTG